jgi:phage gp45-like
MLAARSEHTATLLLNGQVLVAGGANGAANLNYASAELFDPSRRTFSATGTMAAPRYGHTAVLLPSGKVLVVGGATDSGVVVSSAELYDPATGTFTKTDSMTVPRYGHTATLLADGKTLIAGGRDSLSSTMYLRCAELYE